MAPPPTLQHPRRRITQRNSSSSNSRRRRAARALVAALGGVMLPLLLLTASPWRARAFQLLSHAPSRSRTGTGRALAIGAATRRAIPAPAASTRPATALWAAGRRSGKAGAGAGAGNGEGSSSKDKKQDGQEEEQQGPGVGRGPRNRRRTVNNPSDEEEFAALSSTSLPGSGGGGEGDGQGPRAGGLRRPVRVPGPSERPKRAPLSVVPNWSAKGSSGAGPAKTVRPAPRVAGGGGGAAAAAYAAARARALAKDDEDEDDGDDEDELLDVPEGLVVHALDSEAYEAARRAAGLDDDDDDDDEDDDELEEEEDDEWDEEEEEEEEQQEAERPRPSAGALSMAERLKMAQSGTIYNPYVAAMHKRGKTTLAGSDGDSNSNSNSNTAGDARRGGGGGRALDEDDDEDEDEYEDAPAAAAAAAARRMQPQPLRYQYKIVMDAGTCPGCGNAFQTRNDSSPGFVPVDVYHRLQARLMTSRRQAPKQQARSAAAAKKVLDEEEEEDLYQGLTAEEEVELLLSGKDRTAWEEERAGPVVDVVGAAEEEDEEDEEEEEDEAERRGGELGEDEEERMVICQRCHKLKHYGEVEDALRPGWSDNELLTPERFKDLVSVVRKKRCAVVCLVDIFDFHGSLLYNLPRVVGDNPVLVAVNKADLLPSDFSEDRVRVWVKQELEKVGMKDVGTRDVHLVSCKTGHGVKPLLRAMKTLARQRKRDLYVIGAANVGKSTFINRLIELGRTGGSKGGKQGGGKKGGGSDSGKKGTLVTTSPLPGTTLNFIEVDLGDKVSLYDTPGLILKHQITTLLTTEELKAVIPQKRINHVTLRLKEGKSVLLGGLVRLDMVEGRPFLFTFYVSNDVKLHQTATERADEFLQKHVGELVFPPYSAARLEELGPWVPREFDIEGTGWKTSAVDIVISGLGWVSVTGALGCKVRIMAPESVGVRVRSPLMPYETWDTTARWTGLRAVKTGKKGGSR